MKRLLIGSNNKTKKLEKSKAYGVIRNYTDSFSAHEITGYWRNKKEKSLIVEIEKISSKNAYKLGKELVKELKQESVAVQDIKSHTRFIN